MGKDSVFNKWFRSNLMASCLKCQQIHPFLTTLHAKLNSNWIKDHNIWPNTPKLRGEKVGHHLELISAGENFLNTTLIAQALFFFLIEIWGTGHNRVLIRWNTDGWGALKGRSRKMQIKTTLTFRLTPVRMAKIKKQMTAHAGEDAERGEHSSTGAGGARGTLIHCCRQCKPVWRFFRQLARIDLLHRSSHGYTTPHLVPKGCFNQPQRYLITGALLITGKN